MQVITELILKELSDIDVKFIVLLLNAMQKTEHFPRQFKIVKDLTSQL